MDYDRHFRCLYDHGEWNSRLATHRFGGEWSHRANTVQSVGNHRVQCVGCGAAARDELGCSDPSRPQQVLSASSHALSASCYCPALGSSRQNALCCNTSLIPAVVLDGSALLFLCPLHAADCTPLTVDLQETRLLDQQWRILVKCRRIPLVWAGCWLWCLYLARWHTTGSCRRQPSEWHLQPNPIQLFAGLEGPNIRRDDSELRRDQ